MTPTPHVAIDADVYMALADFCEDDGLLVAGAVAEQEPAYRLVNEVLGEYVAERRPRLNAIREAKLAAENEAQAESDRRYAEEAKQGLRGDSARWHQLRVEEEQAEAERSEAAHAAERGKRA